MSLFDPLAPTPPTQIGRVSIQVFSAPDGEGGLEFGGRVQFDATDASGNVLETRQGRIDGNDLTQQQRQGLQQLLTQIRNAAEGALP